MTTYRDVLNRLVAARRAGIVLGLERVAAVLARLDHPERQLGTVVHLAGTNGKGSTAALLAAVASRVGARVAVYTSPHLASLRERFVVDGALASEEDVVAAAAAVAAAGGDSLTFFEQVTAMALWLFARARPDVTVLEVGLGGRLDATNTVDAPVAAVTGVALDHQQMLGPDLASIAREKAGIFKPGQRVVIGASGEPEVVPLLRSAALAAGVAAVRVVDEADVASAPAPSLPGVHQRENAACAEAVLDHLEVLGTLLAPPAVRAAGFAAAVEPGRLEQVDDKPPLFLDGAHNPHALRAIARWLATRSERPRIAVLAVSADKDVDAMVAALAPGVEAVVATCYAQPRALPAAALAARVAAAGLPVETVSTLAEGMFRARKAAGSAGLALVTGSLYAVGEARPSFRPMAVDPVEVGDPAPPA